MNNKTAKTIRKIADEYGERGTTEWKDAYREAKNKYKQWRKVG